MSKPDRAPVIPVVEDTLSLRGMLYFALKQSGLKMLEAPDGLRAVGCCMDKILLRWAARPTRLRRP